MTLKEQWQKDVEQFGYRDLAYLMWEKKEDVNDDYYVFASNLHVFDVIGIVDENGFGSAFGSFHVRRKQSAALPFDKAAALAGDEVEFKTYFSGWVDCKFIGLSREGELALKVKVGSEYHYDKPINPDYLRMKHPRRVGVDYSQFEDKT